MPSFSSYSPGTYSHTIPKYATNVNFTTAAAIGGASSAPTWNNPGGWGRTGDFYLDPVSYEYTLTFYLGTQGGAGSGGAGFGNAGAGGWSPVASGGNGYNHGGGGGGASGVYHSGFGVYVAGLGGGGGAGRNLYTAHYAGKGVAGGEITSAMSFRAGANCPFGNSGGGGGGTSHGVLGGSGGAAPGSGGVYGYGGNSGYYNVQGVTFYYPGYANYGHGYYTLSWDYGPPSIDSFTANPTTLILGNTIQLDWTASGAITSVNLTDVGDLGTNTSGSHTVTPPYSKSYTLQVTGPGGTTAQNQAVTVYVPPEVTLTSDATNNTIVLGQSVDLTWVTTGDADTATFNPDLGSVSVNSSHTATPTDDTTYSISVSGLGGSDSDQLTIIVQKPPTVILTGPTTDVDYNSQVSLSYDGTNVFVAFTLSVRYNYTDGTSSTWQTVESLPTGELVTGSTLHTPSWNQFGPSSIEYKLVGESVGNLLDEQTITVPVTIDTMPDTIVIPSSDEEFINQEVITPDAAVTSEDIEVTDIDIPVEIKSNYPIQVDINDSGTWDDVREI